MVHDFKPLISAYSLCHPHTDLSKNLTFPSKKNIKRTAALPWQTHFKASAFAGATAVSLWQSGTELENDGQRKREKQTRPSAVSLCKGSVVSGEQRRTGGRKAVEAGCPRTPVRAWDGRAAPHQLTVPLLLAGRRLTLLRLGDCLAKCFSLGGRGSPVTL